MGSLEVAEKLRGVTEGAGDGVERGASLMRGMGVLEGVDRALEPFWHRVCIAATTCAYSPLALATEEQYFRELKPLVERNRPHCCRFLLGGILIRQLTREVTLGIGLRLIR